MGDSANRGEVRKPNVPPRVRDNERAFTLVFAGFQALMILFFGLFTKYSDSVDGKATDAKDPMQEIYPLFQDVHVMIFVGFGFLMTFLRKYSYSAVAFTFFIAVFCIQWAILNIGFWNMAVQRHFETIPIDIASFVNADFAAGAVLISFGAIIGRVTPTQLLVMAFCEIAMFSLNQAVLVFKIGIADIGGSYVIHMFGAYFGLTVSLVLGRLTSKRTKRGMEDNAANYHADLFAMIGTLFLWLFWPSFNGALAGDVINARHRSAINTILSISCSCFVAFIGSRALRHGRLFSMVDVQNATLAGGVAMGACANMLVQPWGAMLIGSTAGVISVVGFCYVQGLLTAKIGLLDTCGVHNLHGLPSLFGALASVVVAGILEHNDYGGETYTAVFPEGHDRTAAASAWYQFAGIGITLGFSIIPGAITAYIMSYFASPLPMFDDALYWEVPEDEPEEHLQANERKMVRMDSNSVQIAVHSV